MATLSEMSRASKDEDLIDRFEAAAAAAGVSNPRVWVSERARQLASAPISDQPGAQIIADVYAYAVARQKAFLASTTLDLWSGEVMLPPGFNPAAVTDEYIRHAVSYVLAQEPQ